MYVQNSEDREKWLENRRGRITATKIYNLLGGGGFALFCDQIVECTGHIEGSVLRKKILADPKLKKRVEEHAAKEDIDHPPMVWGREREIDSMIAWYKRFPISGCQTFEYPGALYKHEQRDVYATPDFVVTAPDGRKMVGELKTLWSTKVPQPIDRLPFKYLLQVAHQMFVMKADVGALIYTELDYADPDREDLTKVHMFLNAAPSAVKYIEKAIHPVQSILSDDKDVVRSFIPKVDKMTPMQIYRHVRASLMEPLEHLIRWQFQYSDYEIPMQLADRNQERVLSSSERLLYWIGERGMTLGEQHKQPVEHKPAPEAPHTVETIQSAPSASEH